MSLVRNAFRCLRLANFLLRPSYISVQALLLLAKVLENDLQPDLSWAVLAMTRALAQSFGLDQSLGSPDWAIVWQETYLALCLGRRSATLFDIKGNDAEALEMDYSRGMRAILDLLPTSSKPSSNEFRDAFTAVTRVERNAIRRLRDKEQCRSIQDRIEYFAFQLQTSFVATCLLVNQSANSNGSARQNGASSIAAQCQVCCMQTIDNFLDMQAFTVIPLRSWTFLYSALVSGLLLGFAAQTELREVKRLQQSLYEVFMRLEEEAGIAPGTTQLFRNRYARALETLKVMVSGEFSFRSVHHQNGAVDSTV